MARIGKEREAAALELDGVDPLSFTGRRIGGLVDMGGLVELTPMALADDEIREAVLSLARDFVGSLPAK